jgi:transposase
MPRQASSEGTASERFATVLDNRAPLRVVVEACGSVHYWVRRLARAR